MAGEQGHRRHGLGALNPLLVFVGGGTGAVLRWAIGRWVLAPWGTLLVNIVGCFAMGVVAGLLAGRDADRWRLLVATVLLGGFTTFSAFALDSVTLWRGGSGGAALAYVAASVAGSLLAAIAGIALTR